MTQIDFYANVGDKLRTACTLSAKAVAQGLKVFVCCPDAETAQRFDRMLWTNPALGFTPHCTPRHPLAAVTPVLFDCGDETPSHDEVLINLRADSPAFFSRFRRLIEIVGLDEDDKVKARERFRHYRDRGYELRTHDLSKTGEQ